MAILAYTKFAATTTLLSAQQPGHKNDSIRL